MRTRFAALIPVSIIALAGCASTCGDCDIDGDTAANAESVSFVNTNCPIAGGEIATNVAGSSYEGHDVGFCCPGCKGKWEALAGAEKDAFIVKAIAGEG